MRKTHLVGTDMEFNNILEAKCGLLLRADGIPPKNIPYTRAVGDVTCKNCLRAYQPAPKSSNDSSLTKD